MVNQGVFTIIWKTIFAAILIPTVTLPTPIAIVQSYTPDQAQAVIEIAEGRDGRFAPYHTRSEKAAAEKKIADRKKAAEDARIAAEKKAADEAAQKAAAEAEAQRLANEAAEAEKARQAAAMKPQPAYKAPAVVFGGSCEEWIAAAGIDDPASARTLISRESGCDPYVTNPSSGSCGVAQELPCGKSGCQLGDGACQVRWMNGYVLGTYGSWANALSHSYTYNWY